MNFVSVLFHLFHMNARNKQVRIKANEHDKAETPLHWYVEAGGDAGVVKQGLEVEN